MSQTVPVHRRQIAPVQKRRHILLTAWLVVGIVLNLIALGGYILDSAAVAMILPSSSLWALPILAVLALARIFCASALFLWQRWGFYAYAATSVVTIAINVAARISLVQSLQALIGVAILYGVLQIGGETSGWRQLE